MVTRGYSPAEGDFFRGGECSTGGVVPIKPGEEVDEKRGRIAMVAGGEYTEYTSTWLSEKEGCPVERVASSLGTYLEWFGMSAGRANACILPPPPLFETWSDVLTFILMPLCLDHLLRCRVPPLFAVAGAGIGGLYILLDAVRRMRRFIL